MMSADTSCSIMAEITCACWAGCSSVLAMTVAKPRAESAICSEVANSVKKGLRRSLMTRPMRPVLEDLKVAAERL